MNKTLKSLIAGAALVGVGALPAAAQDYTWTLSNLTFGPAVITEDFNDSGIDLAIGPDNGTASGTFTLRQTGSTLTMIAWDIHTTAGLSPSGYAVHYTSADVGDFGEGGSTDGFSSNANFIDASGNYTLRLIWPGGSIGDAIGGGATQVDLADLDSWEGKFNSSLPSCRDAGPGEDCENLYVRVAGAWDTGLKTFGTPGRLDMDIPEPGTLAVLGFGLVGLMAARRRRA